MGETNHGRLAINAILISLPALAITGSFLMNSFEVNWVTLVVLGVVALVPPLLIGEDGGRSRNYVWAVFAISVCLLLHNSLISQHLWGTDIQREFYFAFQVLSTAHWNNSVPSQFNSVLSVVMLAPIYSLVSGVELTWTFKVVYPLLFSLVPVILFLTFRKCFDDTIAFIGVYYFMSSFVFYTDMLALARQEIAEIFLALILLVAFTKVPSKLRLLVFPLILGLVISHYSLAFLLGLLVVIALAFEAIPWDALFRRLRTFGGAGKDSVRESTDPSGSLVLARPSFLIILLALTFSWYAIAGGGVPLTKATVLVERISNTFLSDFLNPATVQGVKLLSAPLPLLQELTIGLTLTLQILAILGLAIAAVTMRHRLHEPILFGGAALVVSALVFTVPYFAIALQTGRILEVVLFFFAPFATLGVVLAVDFVLRRIARLHVSNKRMLQVGAVVVSVYFLFNCGFFYALGGELPQSAVSISLSNNFDYTTFGLQEWVGGQWLIHHTSIDVPVYADYYRQFLLSDFKGNLSTLIPASLDLPLLSVVFFGTKNTMTSKVLVATSHYGPTSVYTYENVRNSTQSQDLVFANGGSSVMIWR